MIQWINIIGQGEFSATFLETLPKETYLEIPFLLSVPITIKSTLFSLAYSNIFSAGSPISICEKKLQCHYFFV
jgi:hypothetical protein